MHGIEVIHGQLVIGPPGSGKSTYCRYVGFALKNCGRNVKYINLDVGNDNTVYKADIDIREIVKSEQIARELDLGPNGAVIKSMEIVRDKSMWLKERMKQIYFEEFNKFHNECHRLPKDDESELNEAKARLYERYRPYFLIDCPGQNELYCSSDIMSDILSKITSCDSNYDLRLVCVNLCDAYYVKEILVYFNLIITSLSSMLRLALPHINILSKFDTIEEYGETRFNGNYYCQLLDLTKLLEFEFDTPLYKRHKKFAEALIGVIEGYDLVQFHPLDVRDTDQLYYIQKLVDKAGGNEAEDLDLDTMRELGHLHK